MQYWPSQSTEMRILIEEVGRTSTKHHILFATGYAGPDIR